MPHPAQKFAALFAARAASVWRMTDARISLALFAAAFALYAAFALRIAQGDFLDYFNLAFDVDPRRYAQELTRSWAAWPPDYGGPKHPLLFVFRPFAEPFLWLGFDWKEAASLTAALFGAGAVAIAYAFLRTLQIARPDAAMLACLYALSSAQLFNAFITESYVFSLFALALVWRIVAARLEAPQRFRRLRYVAPILTFGITTTNVVQAAIAEAALRFQQSPPREAIVNLIRFGIICGAITLALLILAFPSGMWQIATHPADALRVLLWSQTKGDTVGLPMMFATYFGYAFVAPEFTIVELPGGAPMLDFRQFAMGAAGWPALALWAALLGAGCWRAAHLRDARRFLVWGLAAALAVNLILHMRYQFRGSIFLYAPHMSFVIFALAAFAFDRMSLLLARRPFAMRAALAALIALMAANNLPRAWELASGFDDFPFRPEWGPALEARQ
ncbi:MAG: hypothetical protein Tsb0010_09350 [Parvularculaceae bacterium]